MSSVVLTKNEPGGLKCLQQICRLCLSEESLEDVFAEKGLHQLLLEFLSVQVSNEDQLSHSICTICRLRIIEFHQFWTRCQEVQEVLQSMVQNLSVGMEQGLTTESVDKKHMPFEPREIKTESCEEEHGFVVAIDQAEVDLKSRAETQGTIENYSHDQLGLLVLSDCTELSHDNERDHQRVSSKEAENEQLMYIKDEIHIESVKIEYLENDAGRTDICKGELKSGTIALETSQITQNGEEASIVQAEQCNLCNKVFKNRQQLKSHIRTVHGPKKHNCNVCGLSFPYPRRLKRHQLTQQHLEKLANGDDAVTSQAKAKEALQCKECNKSFRNRRLLKAHLIIHGSKNFECDVCGKPFTFQYTLKRHILTHDPNRIRQPPSDDAHADGPYFCDICRKAFTRRRSLSWHRTQVHGPKIHECHICGRKFSTRNCLCRHVTTHYRN
ncbi:zinc finger protein 836 [Aedes aegypti]|uniref:Uncharacterized protein n=1 Tax=Aedes aegypti TaxID=7159 RepID=A0A6I8TTQ5_AEDAE|nr:zinc finger protein 836 [Aedes aegypti]